jgi:ferredoxin--NADP+ reductase
MGPSLAYNATIVGRTNLTDTLSTFLIQLDQPPRNHPWFTAGQYCVIGLANSERPALGSVRRAMSIASAPEAKGPLEFYIRYVAGPASPNPLTHLLWKRATGDRIYVRSTAAGVFTLNDTIGADDPRLRVMVAAGTGVAPFISMIRSEVYRNRLSDLSRWVLLHGASHPAELGYRRELFEYSAVNRLNYWGTVSRPSEEHNWTGDVGRVESFFAPTRMSDLEQRLGLAANELTPDRAVVFVCGATGTIGATLTLLVDRGFVPHAQAIREALGVPPEAGDSLFYELYDPTPVIDINDPTVIEPLRARMQAALVTIRTARN